MDYQFWGVLSLVVFFTGVIAYWVVSHPLKRFTEDNPEEK